MPVKSSKKAKSTTNEESFSVNSATLISKVKSLIKEGNVRKITILDSKGNVIAIFPLTLGVVGAVIAPPLAAIGAIAALITDCTLKVEKSSKSNKSK
jgi:hypothetical protein